MESSTAEFLIAVDAFAQTPTACSTPTFAQRRTVHVLGAAQGSLGFRSAHPHVILRKKYVLIVPTTEAITAFTSLRTNLSPFTKGCREWDASM